MKKKYKDPFTLFLPKKLSFITQNRFLLIFVKKFTPLPPPTPGWDEKPGGGHKMTQKPKFVSKFFWSLDEVVGDLRSHVCPYICTFVRTCVILFLGNRSLLFSETLQLVVRQLQLGL